MTRRVVGVLALPSMAGAAPPGVAAGEFLRAIVEDTYEVIAGLELVDPALVTPLDGLDDLVWPGTPVLPPSGFASLAADQGALVAGDAPDLPGLLLGKLFRALGRSEVAVCPADNGGLVAMAVRLPLASWLTPDLDMSVAELRERAPSRRSVAVGPGWHRLRSPSDLRLLDPGLEGWESTRALLAGHPLP